MNNDIFIPDEDSIMRYQAQLAALLKSNGQKTETIDMGRLPEIYTVFGIADKQLKTNGKTIFKALGIEGRNKHNVPMETVENLLSLTYDPEAVFKSLSVSNKPGAYIAVLNAKTENQEQIIAILSPSRDGHGFTFIPSVYEKHNFERFLGRIYEEQKVLYIKSEGSEIWGQLQSLPRHNPKPSIKNILTKKDVVKQISSLAAAGGYPGLNPTTEESGVVANPTETQGSNSLSPEPEEKSRSESPPLERRNINSKEKFMSDESDFMEQRQEAESDQEDIWYQNYDKQSSLEPDETLKHTFGNITVNFGIKYPLSEENPETSILFKRELDGDLYKLEFIVNGNIDTAEIFVDNTIKHFDKDPYMMLDLSKSAMSLIGISSFLRLQMEQLAKKDTINQEAELRNPQDLHLAKKAGYVQGVCECVAAIGEDHNLGKKLLSEMGVTKDMAKKFANPETYKALEQGIFAQQQKLEQTRSIKR